MVVQYSKQMLGSVFSTRKYMGIMKDLICIFANQSEVSNNLPTNSIQVQSKRKIFLSETQILGGNMDMVEKDFSDEEQPSKSTKRPLAVCLASSPTYQVS